MLLAPSPPRGEGLGVGLVSADGLSPNPSPPPERGIEFKLGHYLIPNGLMILKSR